MPLANPSAHPLWLNAAIFVAAAVIVWFAAGRLTRHLDAIAVRKRLNHAFVGMLLLGGITSLPEIANVMTASTLGNPALAVNNLLGSAAINIVLLAVADAFVGRSAVTAVVARPSTLMMSTLCILALVLIAAVVTIGDVQIGGVGVGAALIAAVSIACFWGAAGHDARSPWKLDQDAQAEPAPDRDPAPEISDAGLWIRIAAEGAVIFAAGYALSQTGDGIAQQTGIASALVGFVLIGFATSTPELSTIVTALRLKRPEMAFGQVLGTNFINLSLILLSELTFPGGAMINELGAFEVVSALLGAMLIGIMTIGLLEHRDRTIFKMGYDSAAVIILFCAGVGVLAML